MTLLDLFKSGFLLLLHFLGLNEDFIAYDTLFASLNTRMLIFLEASHHEGDRGEEDDAAIEKRTEAYNAVDVAEVLDACERHHGTCDVAEIAEEGSHTLQ